MAVAPLDYVDPRRPLPAELPRRRDGSKRPPRRRTWWPRCARSACWCRPTPCCWCGRPGPARPLVPVVLSVPLLSVLAFYLYWRDKFAAQSAARRTPEAVLHGGQPDRKLAGAWLARRLLRHKSARKNSAGLLG